VDLLKPELDKYSGLIWMDRYSSLADISILLSHQIWKDIESISAWRENQAHLKSQEAGRRVHFEDYRIRIGELLCKGPSNEISLTGDAAHPKGCDYLFSISSSEPFELENFHSFSSINVSSSYCSIASISCTDDAHKLTQKIRSEGPEKGVVSIYKIFRDYGLKDREQAPR